MARDPRGPLSPQSPMFDSLQRQIDELRRELTLLQTNTVTTTQQTDVAEIFDPVEGEHIIDHADGHKHKWFSDGEWREPQGGRTEWVACWDTIYGATYGDSVYRDLFATQYAQSTTGTDIFGVAHHPDPNDEDVPVGEERYGNDFWHRPIIKVSGLFTFTIIFEVTDGDHPKSRHEFLIYPEGMTSGSKAWIPHEDLSGFGFFRGIRLGSDMSGDRDDYSSYDHYDIHSVTLPIKFQDPSGSGGVPESNVEIRARMRFIQPSAGPAEINSWCRAAFYITYHGPLNYDDDFPYFP